jgi:hypothetical protein
VEFADLSFSAAKFNLKLLPESTRLRRKLDRTIKETCSETVPHRITFFGRKKMALGNGNFRCRSSRAATNLLQLC